MMSSSSATFSDVLMVVLKQVAAGQERVAYSENPRVLHELFYSLKQQYSNALPAFGTLHFITSGAYPYSPELSEAFETLQLSGAISRENPSYERFTVRKYDDTADRISELARKVVGDDPEAERALEQVVAKVSEKIAD